MRAAQYVRMSTEHQQYSIANQAAVIAEYARVHGFEVVHTYADAGISGLDLAHRSGLRQLLDDVIGHRADFTAVLVYDVSRWGRFQDADESAHYEFLCKQSGIQIHYCAEPFSNDNSLLASLCKALKRSMAGEYSRELSVKVFAGQERLVKAWLQDGRAAGICIAPSTIERRWNSAQGTEGGRKEVPEHPAGGDDTRPIGRGRSCTPDFLPVSGPGYADKRHRGLSQLVPVSKRWSRLGSRPSAQDPH